VLAHMPIFRRAREALTGGGAQVPAFKPPPVDGCYRVVTTLTIVGPVYEQRNCIERI